MVGDHHQRARAVVRVHAAGGVGEHDDPRAQLPEQQDRLDHEPRVVALVQVEPALEHHDLDAGEAPEQEPADMARRGRLGPARHLVERDRHRVLDGVREPAEPRSQHDADARRDRRPALHGLDEGLQARGLLEGLDRARRVGTAGEEVAHRPRIAARRQGVARDARLKLQRPSGVLTPGCQSRPSGRRPSSRPLRATTRGIEVPEATGERRPLM